MHQLELIHPEMPQLMDALLERNHWSWESVSRGEAKIHGEPVSLEGLQWFLVNMDPVLWAECNYVERLEDGGGLWSYFDYQKLSLRTRCHVVHQDGAEVGKTREILALIGWGILGRPAYTPEKAGSILVGSAQDGDLDEIWDELEYLKSRNPYIDREIVKSTTKPYRRLTARNGLKVLFRPAGHDGRAYRGIHVRGFLLHDESAKVVNPRSWAEFWRAAKPGCEIRIYSVPTGDRTVTFQRIADNAVPSERVVSGDQSPRTIVQQILRNPSLPSDVKALSKELGNRVWVRFHWPKTIMPPPFWSEARRLEYIELFGSTDAPGYKHNVLGEPGDPENSVFPLRLLTPAARFVSEYRTISLQWDSVSGKLDVLVKALNPSYQLDLDDPGEDEIEEESDPIEAGSLAMLEVYKESVDIEDWALWSPLYRRALIHRLVLSTVRPLVGLLTAGVDLASTTTAEIIVERAGPVDTVVLRVSVSGFDYHVQRDLIRELDDLLGVSGGWGIDATGVGKVLCDLLKGDGDDLGRRVDGYVFNHHVPAINPETGEPLLDPQTGAHITMSYKEQATQILELALAGRRKELPNDPQLLFLLQNHTYRESGGRRIYSKLNDHVVDAWRCAALRRLMGSFGASVTPPMVFVTPTQNIIDSAAISSRL
jgi:hypothetical protein